MLDDGLIDALHHVALKYPPPGHLGIAGFEEDPLEEDEDLTVGRLVVVPEAEVTGLH